MNGEPDKGFTVKEILVEIRDDVKDLSMKVDRIDREGSIGTKSQLDDHEQRLRRLSDHIGRLEEDLAARIALDRWRRFWFGVAGVGTLSAISTLVWLAASH
jgi:hypothetical protein